MGISYRLFQILSTAVRFIVHWPLARFYGRKGKVVPPMKNQLLLKSATQLAREIREGKLKSVDVVQAYIDRIQEVDPYINATVDRCFQEALEEAEKADLLVASGKYTEEQLLNEKPLLGVPFSVKLLLMVKGLRCTGGSKLFEDLVATEDAPSVALMKKAGAIVIATTNAPEFGMNIETSNKVHGRTRNPYDTNRTPGGSSGGECALIAAGGSVFGLGNEVLGSLRVPSHFTGTFGHKATAGITAILENALGLVPNGGSFPPERLFGDRLPMPEINKYICVGPLCRYAEDLVTSMKVLSANSEIKLKFEKKINFQKLKICYLKEIYSYIVTPVDPEIARALQKAVSYFEQQYNVKAREVKMPLLMDAPRCIINALHNSLPDLSDTMTGGKGVDFNLRTDFLKTFFGKSTLTFSTLAILNFAYFPLIYKESRNSHYENEVKKWINEFNSFLDEDTVLLMPTMPFSALYHREGFLLAFNICYTAIFNILGLPSTSCPIGFNRHGLPIGIQIIGTKNNDPLTLACAFELEKAFGGWKAPGDEL